MSRNIDTNLSEIQETSQALRAKYLQLLTTINPRLPKIVKNLHKGWIERPNHRKRLRQR